MKGVPIQTKAESWLRTPVLSGPTWSYSEAPGYSGQPRNSSAMTQPKDHISIASQNGKPRMISGALKRKNGENKVISNLEMQEAISIWILQKKNPVFQTQAIVSDPLKVLLFLSWVVMIPASFGLVLPSAGSLVGWLAEMHDSSEVAEQTQREPQLLLHYHHTPARRANQHFWDTQELSFVAENPGNQPLENVQVVVVVVVFLLSGMQDLSSLTRDQTCTLSIQWKLWLLTTGSPEKSQGCSVFTKEFWSRSILFSVIYKTSCLHPEWD